MITPYAITLIERRLAHPEWPVVPNYVGDQRTAQWHAAWREAAVNMLMTGKWHVVFHTLSARQAGWIAKPLKKSHHGSDCYFIPS